MTLQPIYPIVLKPPSGITTWNGWPADVVDTLRRWNRRGDRHSLSFSGHGVFKCWECKAFCEPQKYGTAVLDGNQVCDECLIDLARAPRVPPGFPRLDQSEENR